MNEFANLTSREKNVLVDGVDGCIALILSSFDEFMVLEMLASANAKLTRLAVNRIAELRDMKEACDE